MNNRDENKITNEKPISLSPIGFKEVLAALLKVKPEEERKEKEKNKEPKK